MIVPSDQPGTEPVKPEPVEPGRTSELVAQYLAAYEMMLHSDGTRQPIMGHIRLGYWSRALAVAQLADGLDQGLLACCELCGLTVDGHDAWFVSHRVATGWTWRLACGSCAAGAPFAFQLVTSGSSR